MSSERVDKNTLVGIPLMSLACYSYEHRQCRNPFKCQCSCHPFVYTQAQMDAALAAVRAETWEQAIHSIRLIRDSLSDDDAIRVWSALAKARDGGKQDG